MNLRFRHLLSALLVVGRRNHPVQYSSTAKYIAATAATTKSSVLSREKSSSHIRMSSRSKSSGQAVGNGGQDHDRSNSRSSSYSSGHGHVPGYGQGYGHGYGQGYSQSYAQSYARGYGQGYGQSYWQGYGQGYGFSGSQSYGNSYYGRNGHSYVPGEGYDSRRSNGQSSASDSYGQSYRRTNVSFSRGSDGDIIGYGLHEQAPKESESSSSKKEEPPVPNVLTEMLIPHLQGKSELKVTICKSARDIDDWITVNNVLGESVIGIDVEWTPSGTNGSASTSSSSSTSAAASSSIVPTTKCDLLQLATSEKVAVIQLRSIMSLPPLLFKLLTSRDILKTGVEVDEDGLRLKRRFGIECRGMVDLRAMCFDISGVPVSSSLADLAQEFCGIQSWKQRRVTTSDWSIEDLSGEQLQYSAYDAVAARLIYDALAEPAEKLDASDSKKRSIEFDQFSSKSARTGSLDSALDRPNYSTVTSRRFVTDSYDRSDLSGRYKSSDYPRAEYGMTYSERTVFVDNCLPKSPSLSVTICRSADTIDKWIHDNNILTEAAIGFDVEWKPQFIKGGQEKKISLIQLSTRSTSLLIQAFYLDSFPPSFLALMNSLTVKKIGIAVYMDLMRLQKDYSIPFQGYLDLGYLAKRCLGVVSNSLQDIAKEVCNITILKPKKTIFSDWEADKLQMHQIQYAAYDAVIANHIYDAIIDRTPVPLYLLPEEYDYDYYYTTLKSAENASASVSEAVSGDRSDPVVVDSISDRQPTLCTRGHFKASVMEIFYHSDIAIENFMKFIYDADERWLAANRDWLSKKDSRGMPWSQVLQIYLARLGLMLTSKTTVRRDQGGKVEISLLAKQYSRPGQGSSVSEVNSFSLTSDVAENKAAAREKAAEAAIYVLIGGQRRINAAEMYSCASDKRLELTLPEAITELLKSLESSCDIL